MSLDADVRAYQFDDVPGLTRIRNDVYRQDALTEEGFRGRMEAILQCDGLIWALDVEGKPVGYASIRPVPGLAGVYDLQGCIDPKYQRLGLGSKLLSDLITDLKGSPVRQISHSIRSLDDPAAGFLKRHGFFIEHIEIFLKLNLQKDVPTIELPADFSFEVFSRKLAISHFRRLYDLVFAGSPWYQPYGSERQVSADLVDETDILFLVHQRAPIGFLWMHWPTLEKMEIEPLGILPPYQRQGLGTSLLMAALKQMAEQGASQTTVGVWRDNVSAIRFYKRLGFLKDHEVFYLAFNLNLR